MVWGVAYNCVELITVCDLWLSRSYNVAYNFVELLMVGFIMV